MKSGLGVVQPILKKTGKWDAGEICFIVIINLLMFHVNRSTAQVATTFALVLRRKFRGYVKLRVRQQFTEPTS